MFLEAIDGFKYPFENEIEGVMQNAERRFAENWREGYSSRLKLPYAYTCPSPEKYHFQWFWDSCFHAIALSHLNLEHAKKELHTLVSV
ncbi:hypothetical protein HY439_03385 [Candidatus Microgenomates bacterium]|nr:hypothetical protein [Candidatus Microgenomates bacterium]